MKRCAVATLWVLLAASPAFAQGRSQQAPGKTKPAAAPSRNELTAVAVAPGPGSSGATPLAWIDDASLLPPGTVSLSVSAMRWSGGGVSEVDLPIVDAAIGLAPRLQISASVPRVLGGADPSGAVGGVGTSFFSAKIGVFEDGKGSLKVAVSPAMQILGPGVVDALGPGEGRVRWGLPVSAEVSRGTVRLYGGGGYFSPGLWFGGAAVGAQAAEKVFVTAGFSRAWRRSDTPGVPLSSRDRKEISGGAAFVARPSVALFGSIGRTVRTSIENGAGTMIVGGVSLSFATSAARP